MPTAEANRPPKLPVRVPETDQDIYRLAAQFAGLDYSTWVRRTLDRAARRQVKVVASTSDASEDQAP